MIVRYLTKVLFLLISVTQVRTKCICTQQNQQVICHERSVENQIQSYLRMDNSKKVLQSAIPFNNIARIDIQCDIQELHFDSLTNQQIKVLNLDHNFISKVPHNFFATLPELEELSISHNKLKNPDYDTLTALNKVKILDLSSNLISAINIGVLDELKQLEELRLNANIISILAEGVFDELKNLKYIDLSLNKIPKIEANVFLHSSTLEQLVLNGNPLQGEAALIGLQNLNHLKALQLSKCNIENVQLKPIKNCKSLKELDLSNNNLQNLTADSFSSLTELTNVSLKNCKLLNLHTTTFEQNVQLLALDLSANKFLTLPDELFNNTRELKYLNISHNYIEKIPVNLFQYSNLIEIDISFNQLDTIDPDLLNMETLATVWAQNNKITHLEDLTFATCSFPIRFLNLANNRLVFLGEFFFDWIANLERIEIYGNPWDCKCLEEMQTLLNNRFVDYDQSIYSDGKIPVCVTNDNNVCNYDDTNLTYYYDVYMKSIQNIK